MIDTREITPTVIRENLRKLLQGWFRIDSISLNPPESIRDEGNPPSNLIEQSAAIDTISVDGRGNGAQVINRLNLGYQIIFRCPSYWKYSEIPRGDAENLMSALLAKIHADFDCIHPEILEIKASGVVLVQEETKADWLLVFELRITLNYPVLYPITPPKTVFSN